MRYLLDTNVLSEPARPRPHLPVLEWLRKQSGMDLAISVLTLGEIGKGVALLPTGEKRERLNHWLAHDLPRQFRDRVLPVDERVALEWGRLSAADHQSGRELPVIDGLLLATAMAYDLTLVTRNEGDCGSRGVPILNPWEG
jgi:predicted nucleic acid-binding protein